MPDCIPIFYACDDNFAKFAIVSIRSLLENADKSRRCRIHILNTGLSDFHREKLLEMASDRVQISFPDVTEKLEAIRDRLPIRDYYTKTTYFRLFIPELFPEYEKALYLDSDTVVLGDVSELYDLDLQDCYVAAAHEQAMVQEDAYGTYVEKVLGVDRNAYFNAGVLLLNCKAFREKNLLGRFMELLGQYNFVVTQDEDYLNVLCKDRVLWLHPGWNAEVFGTLPCRLEEIKLIHYIMVSKPWHYRDCRLQEYFWRYASKTDVESEIREELDAYTDEERSRDAASCQKLMETAQAETARPDGYLNRVRKTQAPDRVAVLGRIEDLERRGIFDVDVEDDPPGETLTPDKIEYVKKGVVARVKTGAAFGAAKLYVRRLRRKNQLIFKGIVGLEHFRSLDSGAIITCNHFNAFDSFAMHLVYEAAKQRGRKFYRVIREGNYTGFPGFYGVLMRNCNTLPLSSNLDTMKKFTAGVGELLREGHFVLFYPEQSMWWNYRKPKPLKDGAFKMAARNNVPVLPCFITMRDSDTVAPDGFPVQEYTVHIGAPIYPEAGKTVRENASAMRQANADEWRRVYETVYGMPLVYRTEAPNEPQS